MNRDVGGIVRTNFGFCARIVYRDPREDRVYTYLVRYLEGPWVGSDDWKLPKHLTDPGPEDLARLIERELVR